MTSSQSGPACDNTPLAVSPAWIAANREVKGRQHVTRAWWIGAANMGGSVAFGVSAVRKEWLNVARTLEVGPIRRAFTVILPAAAPTILTGMRISIGIAWLVIVAAEMLVGGTGIGYFVWNEWNNLSIVNVINAILLIGLVGMVLDQILAYCAQLVTFPE